MPVIEVKMGDAQYCLCCDGEDGLIVPYGERATVDSEGEIYTTLIEDADEQSPVVFHLDEVTQVRTEVEEVIFPEDVVTALAAYAAALTAHAEDEDEDEDADTPEIIDTSAQQ